MLSDCSNTHGLFEQRFVVFFFNASVFNECTRMNRVCVCVSVCESLLARVLAATIGSAAAARSMSFLLMLRYLNYARAVKVRHWRFEHVFADTFNRRQIETENRNRENG